MDKDYWDKYYKEHSKDEEISQSSSFAKFCNEYFKTKDSKNILEIGSGNYRDAKFFASKGHTVYAIDQSRYGFEDKDLKNIIQVSDNFVTMDYSKYKNIDIVYSRFTLHAIKENECKIVIDKISKMLKKETLFMIEVRSIKDPLCGQGTKVANNTWVTDHSRRFVDSTKFKQYIKSKNFKINYFVEENNLSIYKDDNPVLIRLVLEKVSNYEN